MKRICSLAAAFYDDRQLPVPGAVGERCHHGGASGCFRLPRVRARSVCPGEFRDHVAHADIPAGQRPGLVDLGDHRTAVLQPQPDAKSLEERLGLANPRQRPEHDDSIPAATGEPAAILRHRQREDAVLVAAIASHDITAAPLGELIDEQPAVGAQHYRPWLGFSLAAQPGDTFLDGPETALPGKMKLDRRRHAVAVGQLPQFDTIPLLLAATQRPRARPSCRRRPVGAVTDRHHGEVAEIEGFGESGLLGRIGREQPKRQPFGRPVPLLFGEGYATNPSTNATEPLADGAGSRCWRLTGVGPLDENFVIPAAARSKPRAHGIDRYRADRRGHLPRRQPLCRLCIPDLEPRGAAGLRGHAHDQPTAIGRQRQRFRGRGDRQHCGLRSGGGKIPDGDSTTKVGGCEEPAVWRGVHGENHTVVFERQPLPRGGLAWIDEFELP